MGGSSKMAENEAMRKDCGNCFSGLFPAALVSSGFSLNVDLASHDHMELPLKRLYFFFLVTEVLIRNLSWY